MSGRGTANALTRLTAMLAAGFFVTSILLTILARYDHQTRSVIDTIGKPASTAPAPAGGTATAPAPAPTTDAGTGKAPLDNLQPILPADPGTAKKP